MPLIHERTFRVRYGECDSLGHVNNPNYLRYMQEAAFDGSAAAGYGVEVYSAMNRIWLARQTEIEYLRPLHYGESVIVKTYVADFRRVMSRRMYEMRLAGTDEPVARAWTEWAFLDTVTGRPAAIPLEAVSAYFPEGAPPPAPPREKFSASPPPPAGVFVQRRRVAWGDMDSAGLVNNPVFLSYADDCGFQCNAAYKWSAQRMLTEGNVIMARKHQIEYLQPAVLNDEIEIVTWLSDVRRISVLRHYTITRVSDGAQLARIQMLGVWINIATGKTARFPQEMLADFAPNVSQ